MEKIPLPSKIEFAEGKRPNQNLVTIEPCYAGYGTTLGNALRRVLLSSLPGAAVTAVKINGVQHEFSTIPHVKEDVVEIILNLKRLRLKLFSEEPVKLVLKAHGEREARAEDIEKTSAAEIANPDLLLATLTDEAASLEMEIYVSQGRGYLPVELRDKEEMEIGVIAIDSIFTPVQNVGLKVENVRVGQMTNFDRLILDIETDGTITPKEALREASKILIDHFNFLTDFDKKTEVIEEKTVTEAGGEEAKKDVPPATTSEEVKAVSGEPEGEKPKRKRGRPRKKPLEE